MIDVLNVGAQPNVDLLDHRRQLGLARDRAYAELVSQQAAVDAAHADIAALERRLGELNERARKTRERWAALVREEHHVDELLSSPTKHNGGGDDDDDADSDVSFEESDRLAVAEALTVAQARAIASDGTLRISRRDALDAVLDALELYLSGSSNQSALLQEQQSIDVRLVFDEQMNAWAAAPNTLRAAVLRALPRSPATPMAVGWLLTAFRGLAIAGAAEKRDAAEWSRLVAQLRETCSPQDDDFGDAVLVAMMRFWLVNQSEETLRTAHERYGIVLQSDDDDDDDDSDEDDEDSDMDS